MKTAHVPLADDHAVVRVGIPSLLEKITGIEVVAEASDGREALELTKKHLPNVVLMDTAMAGLNGLEALGRATKEFSSVKVIILSMHVNEEYVLQAPRAGACGYLLKDAVVAELELALGAVTRGETYLGFFAYPRKQALNRYNAWAAIRQRAKAAGFLTLVGCHTWRATGITIYLENDGRLEHAQQMAGHESPRTTKHTLRRGACSLPDSQ